MFAHTVFVLLSLPALAQAQAVRYECDFPFACVGKGDCGSADFFLEFLVDSQTDEAMVVGNNGMNKVLVSNGYSAVTFLEVLPSGAVQTTTVTKTGSAVHSRNTVIGQQVSNSQYLGNCLVAWAE